MDYTERLYIDLINYYINKNEIELPKTEQIDFDKLISLSTNHNTGGIIYSVVKKNNIDIPEEIYRTFEKGFLTEMMVNSKRETIVGLIKKELDRAMVMHVFFKGVQLAHLYPEHELRTMSDIDILIRDENRQEVHALLTRIGAEYIQENSNEHVWVYRISFINIEVHSRLAFEENLSGKINYDEYFSDMFENIEKQNNYTYYLTDQYNFIYMIYHLAKHFYGSGCGIRMILDITLFYVKTKDTLDWNIINNELKKISLYTFSKNILQLCSKWFDVEYREKTMDKDSMEILERYIISGGIYGFTNRNVDAQKVRKKYKNLQNDNNRINYVKGVIKLAFPSYKKMRQHNDWFRNKPAVLLPAAYVERFVRNSRERGGMLKTAKKVATGREELIEQEKILKIMGFNE